MTFTFPTEVAVVKSKLESEGIECEVLDEHTVQVHNFLSHAIGGVRLQVAESNFKKARVILEENGLVQKESESNQSSIEKTINNPKFQRIVKYSLVGLITTVVLFALTMFVYRYLNQPSEYELLTERNWCLDYFVYQNEEFVPYTVAKGVKFNFIGQCIETLSFDNTGNVHFPGFNSSRINGKWKLENDFIKVTKVDTLDFLLESRYEYTINQRELVLKSDSLTIYCSILRYGNYR